MQASPAKLPDDTWGVRVYDPGQAGAWTGQAVTVQAKSGKSWQSVLTELVSHDEKKGVALYRKAEKKAKAAPAPTATLFAPIAGGAPEADEPVAPVADSEIAHTAAEIAKATTPTDPMITTLADLLATAHQANPGVSIPEIAHAAVALALSKEV